MQREQNRDHLLTVAKLFEPKPVYIISFTRCITPTQGTLFLLVVIWTCICEISFTSHKFILKSISPLACAIKKKRGALGVENFRIFLSKSLLWIYLKKGRGERREWMIPVLEIDKKLWSIFIIFFYYLLNYFFNFLLSV